MDNAGSKFSIIHYPFSVSSPIAPRTLPKQTSDDSKNSIKPQPPNKLRQMFCDRIFFRKNNRFIFCNRFEEGISHENQFKVQSSKFKVQSQMPDADYQVFRFLSVFICVHLWFHFSFCSDSFRAKRAVAEIRSRFSSDR